MSEYKLHYFDIRGKGELMRLVFAAAGQTFEDVRYEPPPFLGGTGKCPPFDADTKAAMPLGQMPVLEVDGHKFCQQSALARFLAKRFDLMGDDDMQAAKVDMVVQTMWDDVAMKCTKIYFESDAVKKAELKDKVIQDLPAFLDKIAAWVEGTFVLGDKLSLADLAIFDVEGLVKVIVPEVEFPSILKKVIANVEADAKVAKWLEARPKTSF